MPNYGGAPTNTNRSEQSYGLPIGTVIPWTAPLGTTRPVGYIICDGAPWLQVTYPQLYAIIGQIHGNGTRNANGTASGLVGTAFNAPDYRAVSHRGPDGGTTQDFGPRTPQNFGGAGSGTGSYEGHSIQGHWHVVWGTIVPRAVRSGWPPGPYASTYFYSNAGVPPATFYGGQGRTVLTGSNGTIHQGKESRGHNAAVTFLIRAF